MPVPRAHACEAGRERGAVEQSLQSAHLFCVYLV